ncbi:hypothetical protein CKO35_11425 [Ectothiorhodospira shaposhnikovii]|nr:hypothetical protein [Ectothiorhodospira shaposhnikovii]
MGSISNIEAQAMYKCRALPRRIADLKAAGGLAKDKPANWLQNKTTQDLDEELTYGNPEIKPMTVKAGR